MTFKRVYVPDPDRKIHLSFFAAGEPYKFLGFIPTDRHLFGVRDGKAGDSLFLLGTDLQGRDLWSRLMLRDADLDDHRPGQRRASASSWASCWAASRATTAAGSTR